MFKKITIITLILIINSTNIFANPSLDDILSEKNKLEQELKETKNNINSLKGNKASVLNEIKTLDRKQSTIEKDIKIISNNLEDKIRNIAKMEEELKEAEEKRDEYKDAFEKRAIRIYKQGKMSYLKVLLKSKNVTDFLNRDKYTKMMMEHDNKTINTMIENEKIIEENRKKLVTDKKKIESLKQQKFSTKRALEQTEKKKNAAVRSIDTDLQKYLRKEEELQRQSEAAEKLLKEIQASMKNVDFNGTFNWVVPQSTRVTSPYGWRTHPIFKTKKMHTGVDIGRNYSLNQTYLHAAATGEVIKAGYSGGYGNVVMIYHGTFKGNEYATLYAHTKKVLVKKGEKVNPGDKIAIMGATGYATGIHLHYEVRKNGKHTNPANYHSVIR